jgi:DNA-binding NtrC family response regulator
MNKILIVDDSEAIRDTLKRTLTLMYFEVVAAGCGREALDLFFSDSFDLVITDLEMPNMDGCILASHIKKISPDTPVILITGSEESAVREWLKTGDIDTVLFKPFSLKDIQKTVHTALALKTIEGVNE